MREDSTGCKSLSQTCFVPHVINVLCPNLVLCYIATFKAIGGMVDGTAVSSNRMTFNILLPLAMNVDCAELVGIIVIITSKVTTFFNRKFFLVVRLILAHVAGEVEFLMVFVRVGISVACINHVRIYHVYRVF